MSVLALAGPLGPTLLRVISGSPGPDEIAAATALLGSLAALAAPENAQEAARRGPTARCRPDPALRPPGSWTARR
ncbi:acyl-CoA carboxylase epsilon subunit [Streptomyces sp. NPDC058382]|uniref:acyl-CoA carboxylase epsilon subunit n=1 Tax=unclassified Streptomyces TaxID=2593676 RepID=UPI00362592C5